MPETQAQEGAAQLRDEMPDSVALIHEPGKLRALPDILGAAHDEQGLIRIECGNRIAPVIAGS